MDNSDLKFLKSLQHELKKQDNDGCADPVYWGIMEKKKLPSLNDGELYFFIEDEEYPCNKHRFSEYLTDLLNDTENEKLKKFWEESDKNDYYTIIEVANELNINYEEAYFKEYDFLSRDTGCFLTKKAAAEYIEKFGYNHCKPRTYGMTAYRNFELERFLKIFKEMDLNKFNK
ncbi:MAG: hypothetical protein [Wendovervirus sonii]|uniref:Uncharacterized protein n=1 Tax=phage Lak_Megaphage_Sonny TaxID=3109229 RepID=A0ABZ0Z5Q0_9CAUD|nr:MAG: hypothetical protein [phage Lak_Megaphage_Sonny]